MPQGCKPNADPNKSHLMGLSRTRRIIQSILWLVVVAVIGLGWKYPLLGFAVPVVMMTGMAGGFVRGRYVCGWLCPRGAFFDRIVGRISLGKTVPAWLRGYGFRWAVFFILIGFMVYQVSLNPGDYRHWGAVFYRMCLITTSIGVVLALFIHPRAWCSFCPIGTFQSAVGGDKCSLEMDEGCVNCGACEAACPMNISILSNMKEGRLQSRDCLKCPECQLACPKGLLHFPDKSRSGASEDA